MELRVVVAGSVRSVRAGHLLYRLVSTCKSHGRLSQNGRCGQLPLAVTALEPAVPDLDQGLNIIFIDIGHNFYLCESHNNPTIIKRFYASRRHIDYILRRLVDGLGVHSMSTVPNCRFRCTHHVDFLKIPFPEKTLGPASIFKKIDDKISETEQSTLIARSGQPPLDQ